jgi:hypothetical protein
MIFGRSTVIIMAAIVATMQFVKQGIFLAFPDVDQGSISTLVDLATGALGAWIAVLAGTSTTPVADPQLKDGTLVKITDEAGTVIAHEPIKAPEAHNEPEA